MWRSFRHRAAGVRGRARATVLAHALAAWRRLRRHSVPIIQTSAAAAIAWWIAGDVLGSSRAIFAPVTTIVALGISRGRRGRQAVQFVLGVALGVGIADVVVGELSGGPIQGGVICALAMALAISITGSTSLVTQAGVSAVLAAGLLHPAGGVSLARLWESLIGGVVALVFSQFLFTPDPIKQLSTAIANALSELASVFDEAAAKLAGGSCDLSAVDLSARLIRTSMDLEESGEVAQSTATHAPRRRMARSRVEQLRGTAALLGAVLGDVAPLLRVCERLVRNEDSQAGDLSALLRRLAEQSRQVAQGKRVIPLTDEDATLLKLTKEESMSSAALVTLAESCSQSLADVGASGIRV